METMTKKQWKREQQLRAALALARVSDTPVSNAFIVLDVFNRYEHKLQRLAEMECNGYPKPVTEYRDGQMFQYNVEDMELRAKCEKQEQRTLDKVKELAKAHNLTVEFQGDPRGLMFRLTFNGQELSYTTGR